MEAGRRWFQSGTDERREAISRDRIPPVIAEEYEGTPRGLFSREADEQKW